MEGTITKHLLENWPSAIWLIVGGVIVWLFLSVKNIANKAKEASEIESQRTAHGNLDVSFRKIALDLEYLNKDTNAKPHHFNRQRQGFSCRIGHQYND